VLIREVPIDTMWGKINYWDYHDESFGSQLCTMHVPHLDLNGDNITSL
jgi:hypothetical protein